MFMHLPRAPSRILAADALRSELLASGKIGERDVMGGHCMLPTCIEASLEQSLEALNLETVRMNLFTASDGLAVLSPLQPPVTALWCAQSTATVRLRHVSHAPSAAVAWQSDSMWHDAKSSCLCFCPLLTRWICCTCTTQWKCSWRPWGAKPS